MAEKVKTSSVDNLINELRSRYTEKDLKTINSAFEMASTGHISQKRKSGEPYITHPLSVAIYLSDLSMDIETITAALLHDLIEYHAQTFAQKRDAPAVRKAPRRVLCATCDMIWHPVWRYFRCSSQRNRAKICASTVSLPARKTELNN